MEKAFEKSHPCVMAVYFIVSIVAVMMINNPLFSATSLIVAILNTKLFVATSTLLKTLKGAGILIFIMLMINIFFNSNGTTVFIVLLGHSITLEVIVYSLVMGLMLLNILQLSLLFNETMNGAKFLYVLSKIAPKTGLVTMLALRYVPLLKIHLQQITTVQKLKGYSVTEGTLNARIKSGLLLLQLLLSISLEDALQTADSTKARGYGLQSNMTSYTRYEWNVYDTISVVAMLSVFIFIIVNASFGIGMITIYPKLQISWAIEHIVMNLVACLLIAFPLILQSLEWCKWKFYSLKM